jgi:transcriptional regulator with XRE-family HTH domain
LAYLSQGRIRIGEQTEETIRMADIRMLSTKNIRQYREVLGISQMELAEKIGCSPTLIGKIEIMKRFPSAIQLTSWQKLSKLLRRKDHLKKQVLKAINEVF